MNSLNKNQPTCEKRKDLFFPINKEVIYTSTDIMWKVWKKFWSKQDEKSIYAPLHIENNEVENQITRCG